MTPKIRYSDFAAAPAPPPQVPAPAPAAAASAPVSRRVTPNRPMRAIAGPRLTPAAPMTLIAAGRRTPSTGMFAIPGAILHGPESAGDGRNEARSLVMAGGTSQALRDRARSRTGVVDLLLFRIGPERFAVELAAVEEVVDLSAIHHVPEMPAAMAGVVTVRGVLTMVYAPAATLGLALATGGSALIFRRGGSRIALAIDDVDDVFRLDLALLRGSPIPEDGDGVVLGVVRTGDLLIVLVDADALIATCQAVPALEIA